MMLFGGALLVILIIGLIVYFTVYHNPDEKQNRMLIDIIKEMTTQTPLLSGGGQ